MLDPVFAADLPHEQLRVGEDLDGRVARLPRLSEAEKERLVLGHVIRGLPDVRLVLLPKTPRLTPHDHTDPRRARIPPSRPIDVKDEGPRCRLPRPAGS